MKNNSWNVVSGTFGQKFTVFAETQEEAHKEMLKKLDLLGFSSSGYYVEKDTEKKWKTQMEAKT